jgi:hypothetical protein
MERTVGQAGMDLGKILIGIGAVILVIGVLVVLASKLGLPLGRLPGDITYRGKNTVVYFPIVTSILLSILLTVIFWIAGKFR